MEEEGPESRCHGDATLRLEASKMQGPLLSNFQVNPKPNDDLEIQLIQTSHELVGVLYTPSSPQTRIHNVK